MRRGFTVLEVLLAMVLGTALLACLWSALSMYLRAFDAGRTDAEQSQLVRALVRRIETDLLRTLPQLKKSMPAPLQPAPTDDSQSWASSPTTIPAEVSVAGAFPIEVGDSASLVGTTTQLRLRVRRPTLAMEELSTIDQLGNEVVRVPDDLKTIYYWLANATDSTGSTGGRSQQGNGLVRREGAWLRWRDAMSGETSQLAQAGDSADPEDMTDFYQSSLPAEETHPVNPELIVAPEVAGLQFRYFDGSEWRENWNSEAEGRLPNAVEVLIYLARDAEEFTNTAETALDAQGSSVEIADYRVLVPFPVNSKGDSHPNPPRPTEGVIPLISPNDEAWP